TSMTSTPCSASSAPMVLAIGLRPRAVSSTACPPRAVKVTAAFAAGPPAATNCERAVIFSSGPGGASTRWMTSSVARPANTPRGRGVVTSGGRGGRESLRGARPRLLPFDLAVLGRGGGHQLGQQMLGGVGDLGDGAVEHLG